MEFSRKDLSLFFWVFAIAAACAIAKFSANFNDKYMRNTTHKTARRAPNRNERRANIGDMDL